MRLVGATARLRATPVKQKKSKSERSVFIFRVDPANFESDQEAKEKIKTSKF